MRPQLVPEKRTATAKAENEPVPLPCPRCDSTNTKFCYFNNYNFSQPRHFCKSCRRYWTQGGTLRDVPFGGGSRKIAKRLRTTATPVLVPHSSAGSISSIGGGGGNGFTSLLSGGGFGLGLGLRDTEFGLERGLWASPQVGYLSGGSMGVASGGGGGGESSGGDCFSFATLPELAIYAHGNVLK